MQLNVNEKGCISMQPFQYRMLSRKTEPEKPVFFFDQAACFALHARTKKATHVRGFLTERDMRLQAHIVDALP